MLSEAELQQVVDLARENGSILVVDETYRDLSMDAVLPLAASLGSQPLRGSPHPPGSRGLEATLEAATELLNLFERVVIVN